MAKAVLCLLFSFISSFATELVFKEGDFLSIKFPVNVRAEPSAKSYVKFSYMKGNEPIKALSSFGNWIKMQDCENDVGWIHTSALSTRRFVVIQILKALHKAPEEKSKILANLKPEVRCLLKTISGDWIQVKTNGIVGWITKKGTWGT